MIELMRLVRDLKADPTLNTPALRRAEIKALYLEAKPIADKLGEIDKTQADLDAAAQRAADSVPWSNEVDALVRFSSSMAAAVDAAHAACPDAARKSRWTVAQVRALFGL